MSVLLAPSEEAIEEVVPVMTDYDTTGEWGVLGDFVWDVHYQDGAGEIVGEHGAERASAATREILRTARDDKSPPPPLRMVPLDDDSIYVADDPLSDVIVLGEAATGGEKELFPTVRKFLRRFRGGDAKLARLDTTETHKEFRGAESPAMAALRADVERLREEFRAHAANPNAHASAGMAEYAEALEILGAATTPERQEIPVQLPPFARGKVDCWLEDDVICCSIKIPGPDGLPRHLSSASPAERHLAEVVGYARMAGCHIPDVAHVLPVVACMMGGGHLAATLAAAAPSALARPEARGGAPFVGRIVPAVKPAVAALAALRGKARAGSAQAAAEWRNLGEVAAKYPALAAYMAEADKLASTSRYKG